MKRGYRIAWVGFLVFAAGFVCWRSLQSPDRALHRHAVTRREVATRVLGQYLAAQFPGRQVLVASNPFTQRPGRPDSVVAFEASGIRGLKAGWGDRLQLLGIAFPELNPDAAANPGAVLMDSQSATPLSFLTTETAWDKMLKAHAGADIVVSLIGVPVNLTTLEIWRAPKPSLALLLPDLRMIGDTAALRQAFARGKLAAVVLNRPGAPPETVPMNKDASAEFEARFLLVTRENLEDLLRLFPQAF